MRCSNGHRFPINPKKHTDRNYVLCPECYDKVMVRKEHFFSPSPDWEKEKERRRSDREYERDVKGRKGKGAPITFYPHLQIPFLSQAMAELMRIQREKKEGAKSE